MRNRATTAKKCTKKRDAFVSFSLALLSLLLKLHIVVIQKFCYHGNVHVTTHFSSLLCRVTDLLN